MCRPGSEADPAEASHDICCTGMRIHIPNTAVNAALIAASTWNMHVVLAAIAIAGS